jgi:hypothetical protein
MSDPPTAIVEDPADEGKDVEAAVDGEASPAIETSTKDVEDAAAVDDETKDDREGSASSASTKSKRKRSNSSESPPPPAKAPRRTKRVVTGPTAAPAPVARERTKSGSSSRKPPAPKRPQRKGSKLTEEVVEDEDIYERGSRCVCGTEGELDPACGRARSRGPADDEKGFMIMCEECKYWQHGGCVGFADPDDCPAEYFCELCRPDLHARHRRTSSSSSSKRPGRVRESADAALVTAFLTKDDVDPATAVDEAEDKPKTSPGPPLYPATSHFAEPKNPGRRRSTMNSRDAAYEESLAAALALSAADTATGRPASTQGVRQSRSATQEVEVAPAPRRRAPANKRKRPTADDDTEAESHRSVIHVLCPCSQIQRACSMKGVMADDPDQPPSRSASPQDSDRALATVARPQRNNKRSNGHAPPPAAAAEESDETANSGSQPSVPSTRAKHPNQYTYRPKGAPIPPSERSSKPSPSKRKQVAIRESSRGRDRDSSVDPASLVPPPLPPANGASKTKRKPKGGAVNTAAALAAAAVANAVAKDELDRRAAGPSASVSPQTTRTPNPWHLPAHLEHLNATLGPAPPRAVQGKPRYPTKRATMGDMRKRAKTMLDYLARSQILLAPAPVSSSTGSSASSANGRSTTAADLIADLAADVKSFSERYASAPTIPIRSGLSQSVVAQ